MAPPIGATAVASCDRAVLRGRAGPRAPARAGHRPRLAYGLRDRLRRQEQRGWWPPPRMREWKHYCGRNAGATGVGLTACSSGAPDPTSRCSAA